MIRAIICDLDGSLMPPSSGLYVSKQIRDALIEIQKKGVLVILNSARIFQGIHPLAKQIRMDEFGGYIVSCNGAQVYDMKKNSVLFEYSIDYKDVQKIMKYGLSKDLSVGYSQPEYFVANQLSQAFDLDRNNCHVDYLITFDLNHYLQSSVCKCCYSCSKEKMDENFEEYKKDLETMCDVKVVHSTPTMIDIISSKCDKYDTVNRLLQEIGIDWIDVSGIGDGTSDAKVLEFCGYGVTLENGNDACKKVAKKIVPSCDKDGCLEWLKEIVCEL